MQVGLFELGEQLGERPDRLVSDPLQVLDVFELLQTIDQPKPTLAAPYAHDSDGARITPVDDPERWMDELPQRVLTEFRDHASHVGMVRQRLDATDEIAGEPDTHIRHALLGIPRMDALKIIQSGFGESNLRGHVLLDAKSGPGFEQGDLPSRLQVCQTFNDGTHERTLLFGRLVVGDGLHYRNAAPPAGQQNGAVRVGGVLHHTSGIDLQIRQWHDILREPDGHGRHNLEVTCSQLQ